MKGMKKLSASFPEFFKNSEFHNFKSGIVGHFDPAKLKNANGTRNNFTSLSKIYFLTSGSNIFDFRFDQTSLTSNSCRLPLPFFTPS